MLRSKSFAQGRRKHLKLGGTTLGGHFFLKKKKPFSKNEKGTSLFTAKSWGHVPPVPRFLRLCVLEWYSGLLESL